MAKVSLVTVLYNGDNVLEGFFKSLSSQSFKDYHLYLIDNSPNANTDKLIERLLLKYPIASFSYIKNSKNEGIARANNTGIKNSMEDKSVYTILLNNDIEFYQSDFIEKMIEKADSADENIIIPKTFYWDSGKIWMAGGKLHMLMGVTSHVGDGKEDGPQYSKDEYFKYAPTCFMLVKNDVFEKIGMMDEQYFVYFDDTDFVYRAVQAGYRILLMHELHLYHKVSSITGGGDSLFTIYYGNRNRIYFIKKNFNAFYCTVSMAFTLISRIWKYLEYDKQQRKKLIRGVIDGFKLSTNNKVL